MTRLTSAIRLFPSVNMGRFWRGGLGMVEDGDALVVVCVCLEGVCR